MTGAEMHQRYEHPEALPDEAFIINVRVATYFGGRLIISPQFGREKWKTKRLGGIAYDTEGKKINGYRPMFVKKAEAEMVFSLNDAGAIEASYYR
jgi:hypothetical protein